jgi:Zn-dependent protease
MGYSDKIGTSELVELLLSFIVLTVSFAYVGIGLPDLVGMKALTPDNIIVVGVAVGTGFLLHELAHKFVAQRFGYRAEYKASIWGLALTAMMALSIGIVFAAPGAVMIRKASYSTPRSTYEYSESDEAYWDHLEKKIGSEDLWISLAGPMTNIILVAFFFTLVTMMMNGMLLDYFFIAFTAFKINLMLAAFNLIPIDPLDGGKIFRGNALLWIVIAVPTILFALYMLIPGNAFPVIYFK